MADIVRNCTSCLYSREQDLIGADQKLVIGQKVYTCQRFPPVPVLLPNPAAGPGVMTLTPTFPIVNKGISCAEHQFEDGSDKLSFPPLKPN